MTVEGSDLPHAVLDYIRNNDVAILEGCDKVIEIPAPSGSAS